MVMPAKPEVTSCWPQARRVKGMAFVNSPIPRQCSQIRRCRGVANPGRPSPARKATATKSSAASTIRAVDTCNGARLSSDSSTPRKAPPQINPNSASSPQSRSVGRRRGVASDMAIRLPSCGHETLVCPSAGLQEWRPSGQPLSRHLQIVCREA